MKIYEPISYAIKKTYAAMGLKPFDTGAETDICDFCLKECESEHIRIIGDQKVCTFCIETN